MMAVNDKPFNKLFSLKAKETAKKNKASDHPAAFIRSEYQHTIAATSNKADSNKNKTDFLCNNIL